MISNVRPQNGLAGENKSHVGLFIAGAFGIAGTALVALATPFILPALRKHCLPFVPATNDQLVNLLKAFKKHAKNGDRFVDIGSGDGRICQLALQTNLFSQIHGVELNTLLVIYSRALAMKSGQSNKIKFYRDDLWRFPLNKYNSISVFGVESMMDPLEEYLRTTNVMGQTIFACRFPFKSLRLIDEIGQGIDTVWVYKLDTSGIDCVIDGKQKNR